MRNGLKHCWLMRALSSISLYEVPAMQAESTGESRDEIHLESREAAVFPEIAEMIYGITTANIPSTAPGESLPVELLDKLNEPKNSSITPKAYMYSYAGISQLKFAVHSMSIETTTQKLTDIAETLALPPPTPTKKEKANSPSASEDAVETNPTKKRKLDSNQEI